MAECPAGCEALSWAFRERFRRVVGTTPHAYRSAFQGKRAAVGAGAQS